MTIDTETSLGRLVADNPAFAPVLERHRLDYCCGGKQSLADACHSRGLNLDDVLAELTLVVGAGPDRDWSTAPLGELTTFIEEHYHEALRRDLPSLEARAQKVNRVHGAARSELRQVERLVLKLSQELLHHTDKEEAVLFPWIRELEQGVPVERALDGPVSVMEDEHQAAGDILAELRSLTADFTPPADACGTYRALYAGLERFEEELHRHIHLENSILFPRALALSKGSPV